jgi:peroxiredoxin
MSLLNLASRLPDGLKSAIKDRIYPPLLGEGETAPEWHLQARTGKWFRQGGHWTVMAFTSADFSDAATRQWLSDIEEQGERFLELGCHAVSVSPAEPDALERLAQELSLSFPLLTDPGCTVAKQFHAAFQLPSGPLMIPSLYLVNPERKLRLSNRGMPSIAAVVRSIQALQQATRQGM